MATIHTLSDEVASRIAAGEVVERPASVVKELVENAVDAGATRVWIRTAGAGESLVEVTDDGAGMSREDVVLAPRNFSTSKIKSADDLNRITTYGFRGEALASISAVSRFELISSENTSGEGWKVTVEGKSGSPGEPAPHERGTTVRVRDLFFNTPARKRFLKTPLTERKRILETILSFAMILPDTEIHYVDDSHHVLDLLPAPSWRERIASILGSSTMQHVVPVEDLGGPIKIVGLVSLPSYTRANRLQQYFFINRRAVREKTLVHAVQDSFRNVIPPKRFPVAVLSLEIPSQEVDVNVHPSKLEVRVRDERLLFSTVRRALKRALSAHSETGMQVSAAPEDAAPAGTAAPPLPGPGDLFQKGGKAKIISLEGRVRDAYSEYMANHPVGGVPNPFNPPLSLKTEEPPAGTKEAVDDLKKKAISDEGLFWQFNDSYIFIQVRGGIVIIDQHAAHERIIFDTARKQLQDQAPLSQQILFRIHLELSLRELEVFRSSKDVFKKLGFDLEPFGGTSILVRGYPQGLKNWEEGKLLLQIFDDILQERVPGDTVTDKVVASFACRSAIKARKKLSVEEMKLLADQLFAVDNPYSCPHGRPTIHRISLETVEKWFQRR